MKKAYHCTSFTPYTICHFTFLHVHLLTNRNPHQTKQQKLQNPLSTKKQELTPVTLNEVAHSIFYAPMYVAIEKGYFANEGIDLSLVTGFGVSWLVQDDFDYLT